MRHFLHYKLLGKYKGGHLQTVFFLGLKQWREFFRKFIFKKLFLFFFKSNEEEEEK